MVNIVTFVGFRRSITPIATSWIRPWSGAKSDWKFLQNRIGTRTQKSQSPHTKDEHWTGLDPGYNDFFLFGSEL